MEPFAVFLIVGIAVAYAFWRTIAALRRQDDPCEGCAGCTMKDNRHEKTGKRPCNEKKAMKNLVN